MNKEILKLSIPNIITNITIPLLGMVDLAIVGRLGDYRYIGAIAIATSIFNLIYWNFGFLRMGTTGFTAQSYGARSFRECANILARGIVVALFIAFTLIALQKPLLRLSLYILNANGDSASMAIDYFNIRIWAAPATLSLYVTKGWFIGMQNSKTPMIIAISMNIINIISSILFAFTLKMGIAGVALGTLLSQYSGLAMSLLIINRRYKRVIKQIEYGSILAVNQMRHFFSVNRDIFLRTVCLSAVFTFFTSASSSMGDEILAVNTLLLQLFTLFSYFMDGFGYAAESLVGKFVGAKNTPQLKKCIKFLLLWGIVISIPFTLSYLCLLTPILSIFTDSSEVLHRALDFKYWIAAVPIISFVAFLYDGILVGATESAIMRNVMFIATSLFFVLYYCLHNHLENSALWISFLVYLLLRGVLQMWLYARKPLTNHR